MSQNPYASNYGGTTFEPAPEARTSVLAILSLVSSLICCVPVVTGALGVVLGGAALMRIGGSGGKRKGTGLAIAGIVIGLIVSIIWLFVGIGAHSAIKQFSSLVQPVVNSLNMSDAQKLRSSLNPTLAAQVTDADWAAFKKQIDDELGTVQTFDSVWEFGAAYGKAGELMQNHPQSNNEVPVPIKGTKGYGMLLIQLPRNGRNQGSSVEEAILGNALNIGVILPSGKTVYLVDPDTLKTAPPAAPAPKPSKPTAPAGGV